MGWSIESVKAVVFRCAEIISEHKDTLGQIDRQTGDGDLGISMDKASTALRLIICEYTASDIGKFFSKCAFVINSSAPSTMGTLISAGFIQLGKRFCGCEEVSEEQLYEIPQIFANAIQQRGKAKIGDCTILDALIPACIAINEHKTGGFALALKAGAAAADEGAKKTQLLVPKVGRAKWAPDNAVGVPDGGAVLCAILLNALSEK